MFLRNRLKPGDFVTLVPLGVHITVQYNASGNIERVYTGFLHERKDVSDQLLSAFIKNRTVPIKIHITRGTSWVCGVLYTGELVSASGILPHAIENHLLKKYLANPTQFNFFAGHFESTATTFQGANPIRHCLAVAKFNILPGWLVPAKMDESVFNSWVGSTQYTFTNRLVADYIIHHKGEVDYVSTKLAQCIVSKVEKYTDPYGHVMARLYYDSVCISVDYSDVIRLNIQPNTLIIRDGDGRIIHAVTNNKRTTKVGSVLQCDICGKSFTAPTTGTVQCSDVHCPSKLLSRIQQFLSKLYHTTPSIDIISSWLRNKSVMCIPDLFLLPEYADTKVEITLATVLRALVPIQLIPRDDVFMVFANGCTNNVKTFRYYIQHPHNVISDLGVQHPDLNKLISWLCDDSNVCDIETILNSPQILLIKTDKKFEGAPIFRNKTIYITGEFIRGSHVEISAILQSYAASVTTQFSDTVNCVLVGGVQNGVNGQALNTAKASGIPIMQEESFFQQYDIDADLRDNLVYYQ